MGAELGIEGIGALDKSTLVCEILRANAEKCGQMFGSGYLEVLPDALLQLSALFRGHLSVAVADQAFCAENRRLHRRPDPYPARKGTLFRDAEGREHQQ